MKNCNALEITIYHCHESLKTSSSYKTLYIPTH